MVTWQFNDYWLDCSKISYNWRSKSLSVKRIEGGIRWKRGVNKEKTRGEESENEGSINGLGLAEVLGVKVAQELDTMQKKMPQQEQKH